MDADSVLGIAGLPRASCSRVYAVRQRTQVHAGSYMLNCLWDRRVQINEPGGWNLRK